MAAKDVLLDWLKELDLEQSIKKIIAESLGSNTAEGVTRAKVDVNESNGELVITGLESEVLPMFAEKILERAKYYCPVDTGALRDSGHIEYSGDGKCKIVFDEPYAIYVHEITWNRHKFPTCDHFLDRAIQEIMFMSNMK